MKANLRNYLFYVFLGLLPVPILAFPSLSKRLADMQAMNVVLPLAPWLGFVALGFLGWKLNQTRILLVSILSLGLYWACGHLAFLNLRVMPWQDFLRIIGLAWPVSLVLLFLARESALFSNRTLGRLVLGLLPFLVLAGLWKLDYRDYKPFMAPNLFHWAWPLRLPQASVVPVLGLAALVAFNRDRKTHLFLACLLATLPAYYGLLHKVMGWPDDSKPFTVQLAAAVVFTAIVAGLLQVIFLMYWQRVYVDELTQIPNRRALDEALHTLQGGFHVAMLDIDHFKRFNDTFGHEEGDNVLRLVARHLEGHFGERAHRYGGEEFCVLFRGLPVAACRAALDAMREELASKVFVIRGPRARRKGDKKPARPSPTGRPGEKVHVTVSAGLAGPDEKNAAPGQVIQLADQALYRAKEKGRNRVEA